jgi:hypothetical protein
VIAELVGPCYVEFDEAMADLNWTESTGFVMEVVLVSDLKL